MFISTSTNKSKDFFIHEKNCNSKINIECKQSPVLDPAFMIVLAWEPGFDVDLFVKFREKYCDEQNKNTSFGKWKNIKDLHPQYIQEAFIQTEIIPGHYEIYANLYRPKYSTTKVTGYAVINPNYGEKKNIDFGEFEIKTTKPPYREGGGTLIGTIELVKNDFTFKRAY